MFSQDPFSFCSSRTPKIQMLVHLMLSLGLPCGSAGKETVCSAGDLSLIPGLGRSPGEGKGYPLQYSGLENSMECIVHGVANSQTWLSDFHFYFQMSLRLSSFLLILFSLFCSLAVISTILSSNSLIHSSALIFSYWFLLVNFSFQLLWCYHCLFFSSLHHF